MKFKLHTGRIHIDSDAATIDIEPIEIEIEYTAEEFIKVYEVLPQAIAKLAEMQDGLRG